MLRFRDGAAVDRDANASGCRAAGQRRPPIISVSGPPCRRIHPSIAAGRRALRRVATATPAVSGRQRPALAEIPGRRIDRVPVHLVRPNAADELAETERPPVRRARRRRGGRARDRCAAGRRRTRPVRGRRRSSTSRARATRAAAARRAARQNAGASAPIHFKGRLQIEILTAMHRQHRRLRSPRSRPRMSASMPERRARLRSHTAIERRLADRERDAQRRPATAQAPQRGIAAREPDRRQIRDRHDQRQRVAGRDRLLEQQVEDQVRAERRGQRQPRPCGASASSQIAPDAAQTSTAAAERPPSPRVQEARIRARPATAAACGFVQSIVTPERSAPPWNATRVPVAARPARRAAAAAPPRSARRRRRRRAIDSAASSRQAARLPRDDQQQAAAASARPPASGCRRPGRPRGRRTRARGSSAPARAAPARTAPRQGRARR